MSYINPVPYDGALSMNGCGYKITDGRVIISIESIESNRPNNNTSGTLQLQLCAFSTESSHLEKVILASTTIGEMKGQHFIPNCHYDLIFQSPPEGSWKIALQLNEWDGTDYVLYHTVYFDAPYHVAPNIDFNGIKSLKKDTSIKATPSSHHIINKVKRKTLLECKGIPKKALERIIAERPFQSEKAILSVKGIGPAMLEKLLNELTN